MPGHQSTAGQLETRSYGELAATMMGELLDVLVPAMERLEWTPDQLAAHRRAALRETLDFAADRSRWHSARLDGIDRSEIEADDLGALPTMTKADLMAHWDDVVTDPRLELAAARGHLDRLDAEGPAFLLDEYHVFTTGGSTGEPGVFCWSRDEVQRWAASTLRWSAVAGLGPPERTAWVGARSPRHPSAAMGILSSGGSTELVIPVDQPVADIVARLNELQPDSLWVVCSMLPALVDAAQRGTLRITVDRIVVGGDVLDDAAVERADAVFGVRPLEGYPTTDAGHIAHQTPGESGLYLNEDLLVVETVDEHDRPVPPGALCDHLLVTSLHQRTLPLIRYRIDDRVRIDPAPGRYRAFRRIAEIDGRSDDQFRYGSITVHPHVFRAAISRHEPVSDFLVEQTRRGATVTVVASPGFDPCGLTRELTTALDRAGLPGAEVNVSSREALPRTAVGKRRRFVPLPVRT